MRRTKQWWARLTKEERSELHCLEYDISNWMNRGNRPQMECTHCGGFRGRNSGWICGKCLDRRNWLVKKANEDPNSQS